MGEGASHCSDIPFVFDVTSGPYPRYKLNVPVERRIGETLARLHVQFARAGVNDLAVDGVSWPRYMAKPGGSGQLLEISKSGDLVVGEPRVAQCEFWDANIA